MMKNITYKLDSIEAGLSTGFRDLDGLLNKLTPSELILIAARPSLGKTCFVLNIAQHVAIEEGKHVAFFSTENYIENMIFKLVSSIGGISASKLRSRTLSDADKKVVPGLIKSISRLPIHFNDSSTISVSEICDECRRIKEDNRLDLVVLDHLQLLTLQNDSHIPESCQSRADECTQIASQLKDLAVELNVPVLLTSLLNRDGDTREDPRPVLSDLRDCGRAEQISDSVIFIYRDEVYNQNTDMLGIADIIVSRSRNSQKGRVLLKFHGDYQRFESIEFPMFLHFLDDI